MADEVAKSEFLKVAVKRDMKREIDLIAADEQRPVYVVVEEMVNMYKQAKHGEQLPRAKKSKKALSTKLVAA